MSENTTHHVNESADKIELRTTIKRGNATRDEDRYKLKVKGDNPAEVAEQMRELIDAMNAENLTENVRVMQPGDSNE
jgi:CTP:molybdopterin cytidylyltransferase MocA